VSIRPPLAAALVALAIVGCGADNPDPVEPAHTISEPWWPSGDELLSPTGYDVTGAQTGTAP
jgi:hypothetical protein